MIGGGKFQQMDSWFNLLLFSAVFFDFKEKEREERDQDRIFLFQLMYHNLIYCTQIIQIKEISIRLQ